MQFTTDQLKGAWRKYKILMKDEVRLLKTESASFDCVRWLRAAIRKLELQLGNRRQRTQVPLIIDTRKVAKRYDLLSFLANAEESSSHEINGVNSFEQSASSSFNSYQPRPSVSRPMTRKIYAPDSLVLVDNAS